jgi:hypothetical protein
MWATLVRVMTAYSFFHSNNKLIDVFTLCEHNIEYGSVSDIECSLHLLEWLVTERYNCYSRHSCWDCWCCRDCRDGSLYAEAKVDRNSMIV